ncbi:conserved phage C-terminal domain-containing protein [Limosilactobacillus sp. STM2_1]|uniref:Conserved phage C-terminal domain-containing protein n=1 Tax=Limosilactobacillus rudii TaxID=2759755 RepID=A0A7W3UK89_9LACO|nr:conserved phage C-terminal domain-containing protein [Limosilactobacillus rudii]MBB1078936.1 conserved phage C-terminal domain-containing protein [Limosilactobacillus rudii]MBB1097117.1 conserved phage C-terminal domain-containing protein [Limosilactobacillus rudii]MCD7134110.1 conserved phage C-terminal domain-containing protein [Limosilactobacillus rudii]
MARLIKRTQNNYTNVSNQLIRDDRLSWKARGIFIYLWSQADNWQFYVSEVAKHATDGRESLQNGLKELEEFGYLKRVNRQNNGGKFSGMEWILSDIPDRQTGNTVDGENDKKRGENTENPSDGKTTQRETDPTENPSLRNNNSKNYQRQEETIESKKYNSQAQPDDTLTSQRKEVISYLNEKTGKNFKPNASGNKKAIDPRLKEGYTVEDMKKIIDIKYQQWHGKVFGNGQPGDNYLKPETLFRPSKIDGYLNEIVQPAQKPNSSNDFSFF